MAERAPRPDRQPKPLSPASLGGAKALPGGGGRDLDAALAHGALVHRLLEDLPGYPRKDWDRVARYLRATPAAQAEAFAVLDAPDLAHLFSDGALREIGLSASLSDLGGARVNGAIDCLVVGKSRVLIVDYKTNAEVPASPEEVPDGILRQLGAYAAAVTQIFPQKTIETAVLWTRTATLMPLPHDIVSAALRSPPAS
jgi:ATP-dependent helicase/nuclease subunit A